MSDDNQEIEELQADIENAWVALGMGDYEGEDDLAHFIAALKAENAALTEQLAAREWRDISSAPKDRTEIILYWPSYCYEMDDLLRDPGEPLVATGRWKYNPRLDEFYPNGKTRQKSVERMDALRAIGISGPSYFAPTDESDDYGLAQVKHAATHWQPLPAAPVSHPD